MLQFHILSFEGPAPYSRAGGIASRITGLCEALAAAEFDTHLWFIGDPDLPGEEDRDRLTLHRRCQWISRFHPNGVYDGEPGEQADYSASLPPFLLSHMLFSHLSSLENHAVVLAEEWQAVDAVLHLDWLLRTAGLRQRVNILWNANNTIGLVGLEAMAAGGVACVGGTGEDYATPGWNSLVLQTVNPHEFFELMHWLRSNPHEERLLRSRAVATAQHYAWPAVVNRNLLPLLHLDAPSSA